MFEGLICNTRLKEELTAAITADRPLQAYLLCGETGSGKHTAARMIAAGVVGSDRALRGAHSDVFELLPLPDRKTVSVEQVRDMRSDAFVSPTEAKRKAYIIDVTLFGSEACQNALLTVLEQPPSFSVFILISDRRGRVLPTVVSRCAAYDMEFVPPAETARFILEKDPSVPPRRAELAAKLSGGVIGKAIELCSGEPEKQEERAKRLVAAALTGDSFSASAQIAGMKKDEALRFLPVLAEYLEGAIAGRNSVLQNGGNSAKIDLNVLYAAVMSCERAIELINANVSLPLALESVVITLGGK